MSAGDASVRSPRLLIENLLGLATMNVLWTEVNLPEIIIFTIVESPRHGFSLKGDHMSIIAVRFQQRLFKLPTDGYHWRLRAAFHNAFPPSTRKKN